MIYQHPLAYLLGLEGLALLRAWAGDFDRDFVLERLAEVRRLLDEPALKDHPGVEVARRSSEHGYAQAAATYDDPSNGLFALDEPAVIAIVDTLPAGDALDAACGTGRFASLLEGRGHKVIGVDSSQEMLDIARSKVPTAEFHVGNLYSLPLPDGSVDLVVCALALTHVPDLVPVMTEFARVVRPGGHVVVADAHHELVLRGSVIRALGPNGEPGRAPAYRHTPGDYLRAALPVGLEVRLFDEPGRPPEGSSADPTPPPDEVTVGDWDSWPWTLLPLAPAAAAAAWSSPALMVWHFQRTNDRP